MRKKAVFLDLQGTLGGEGTGDIRDFTLFPFSCEAIKLIHDNDMLAIVITNQSHIAKGYLTLAEYYEYEDRLRLELLNHGAKVDGIYCCPHRKEDKCDCKKPLIGLIEQAQKDFDIDLSNSYLIGDMGCTDMVLANRIGCYGILVRTGVGEGSLNEFRHTWNGIEPDFVAYNVLDGIKWIFKMKATN